MSDTSMVTLDTWTVIKEQATMLVRSGLLPKGIDTPEKAIAIALKGREIGVPIMQSFSHISVINGKPCASAELQMALIRKNCPQAKIEILKNTDEGAAISATRPGEKPVVFEFNKVDAQRAKLLDKDVWRLYPKAMYWARVVSQMARSLFPDAIMGISYTPEELGAEIDESGEIVAVPTQKALKVEELYTASLEQKKILAKACLDNSITSRDVMNDLSQKCLNAPMSEIHNIVKKHTPAFE